MNEQEDRRGLRLEDKNDAPLCTVIDDLHSYENMCEITYVLVCGYDKIVVH